jgi:hypothetical protein
MGKSENKQQRAREISFPMLLCATRVSVFQLDMPLLLTKEQLMHTALVCNDFGRVLFREEVKSRVIYPPEAETRNTETEKIVHVFNVHET